MKITLAFYYSDVPFRNRDRKTTTLFFSTPVHVIISLSSTGFQEFQGQEKQRCKALYYSITCRDAPVLRYSRHRQMQESR